MAGKGGLGGKQLAYEAVVPRFLQAAMQRQQASAERAEPPSADEASDEPLVVADEATRLAYDEQRRLEQRQQEALDAERAHHEEQRLQRAVQARSKFDTNAATTHVFRAPAKSDAPSGDSTGKKRAPTMTLASAAKKARVEPTRRLNMLSFQAEFDEDDDTD